MTIVISMWSGPRNISTTMMRSFGNRGGYGPVDEPLWILPKAKRRHPYRDETLAAWPNDIWEALSNG
ncbi:MAG: hypothetical protein R3C60_15320 [Parvularculaceae bacterium]